MYQQIVNKEYKLAVIGLGYVGLPLALEFSKKVSVIGFDINAKRVEMMRNGIDPSRELDIEAFEDADITFTSDLEVLKQARFFIVAVPTPIDEHKVPDLIPLIKASETIGKVIKPGDYVVYESTTYPGCTEEDCLPIIEKISGLKLGKDFKLGYSPERINPGDKQHTLATIKKIVSGSDQEALDVIAEVYDLVVTAGLHKASSIKVAEAGKIIENTQRDLNIALMNELSIICDKMGINTQEVIEAAGTKWNFHKYFPGLVGGHCIGVDPYYLTYKAAKLGYNSRVITAGRFINDAMPGYVAKKIVQHILKYTKDISKARVLVLGSTFKENVTDIRNSKVTDMVKELLGYSLTVDFFDPLADAAEVKHEYGLSLVNEIGTGYDVIIMAVAHDAFKQWDESFFAGIANKNCLFADLKGVYKGKISELNYWSL